MAVSREFLRLDPASASPISNGAEKALLEAEKEISLMVRLRKGARRTAANTLEPLNRAHIATSGAREQASLFSAVHPERTVRDASEKSLLKLSSFFTKLYLRRDVYEALKGLDPKGLKPEERRLLGKELLDFRLSGVEKPPKIRAEVRRLVARATKLGQAFDRNIKDDVRSIAVKPEDLAGFPDDYARSHKAAKDGAVKISTQYPDYFPFMQYAKNPKLRRKLNHLYLNRGWPKNERVLTELLAVRRKQANLLGFKDWADYATADKMVRSSKNAHAFLSRIGRFTKKASDAELKMLVARKKKDDPRARRIELWEVSYYENILIKETVGLDTQEVRKYLSFEMVRQGVLRAAGRLFGLSFRPARARTWHASVETYDVYRNGKPIGRFHLDLHPREGKYNHAACFEVRTGVSGLQLPEAALVCNFSKDLMSHGEVTTFFHEFGHLVHFILGGGRRWIRFSGFATEWDFVEAPSQMLEAWALDPATLRTFARHIATGRPIPRALVKKMKIAEHSGEGGAWRRQIFLSKLSLRYHAAPLHGKNALVAAMRAEEKKWSPYRYPEGTHFYAGFGHLNGYSALYYTYTWSRAIAEDILTPFAKRGMYDRATAMRYAKEVLEPGGSRDASDMIRRFLGRKWNVSAFKRWLAAKPVRSARPAGFFGSAHPFLR